MSMTENKVAEMLALPVEDRAYLVRQLIESLDQEEDADAAESWNTEIDRRTREIENGAVDCRPVAESISDIRAKLNARRHTS